MESHLLKLAVVGHTNVGKTSLLRTLIRNTSFGTVSNRPATTRHAEAVPLDLGEGFGFELIDTPGFEDSSGLLDLILSLQRDARESGAEILQRFLANPAADGEFAQEAKAIRQMLICDLMLLVIDAREPVLGKYVDEFRLLGRLGKPCVVVLNFTAKATADTARWRGAAQQAGLYNVTAFDTVVFDRLDEQSLWQQIELLVPAAVEHCQRLLALRAQTLQMQRAVGAKMIARMLLDCTALRSQAQSDLETRVREVEAALHTDLLRVYEFNEEDYAAREIPLPSMRWSWSPFAPEVLEEFGLSLGISAAKGAAVGATVDAFTAFHSLGLATLIGAGIGAGLDAATRFGKALRERLGDIAYLQIELGVALLLARRAVELVRDLEHRGHAALSTVSARAVLATPLFNEPTLTRLLEKCQRHPDWSGLAQTAAQDNQARAKTLASVTQVIVAAFAADSRL